MTTNEILKQIQFHPIICEIGFGLHLSIPFYHLADNNLFVRFYLYRQTKDENRIYAYRPSYVLEFVYPFRHLCKFENLVLTGRSDVDERVFSFSHRDYHEKYKPALQQYKQMSDDLLNAYALKNLDNAQIEECQGFLRDSFAQINFDK